MHKNSRSFYPSLSCKALNLSPGTLRGSHSIHSMSHSLWMGKKEENDEKRRVSGWLANWSWKLWVGIEWEWEILILLPLKILEHNRKTIIICFLIFFRMGSLIAFWRLMELTCFFRRKHWYQSIYRMNIFHTGATTFVCFWVGLGFWEWIKTPPLFVLLEKSRSMRPSFGFTIVDWENV